MLGKSIRAAREQIGISQAELARRIGVGPVTMWKYESGRLAVTSIRLRSIATALNVTIDSLMPEPGPERKGAA